MRKPVSAIPVCPPDRLIDAVYCPARGLEKLPTPLFARDIRCPVCNSDKGFYIPVGRTWSCSSDSCLSLGRTQPRPCIAVAPPKVSLFSYEVHSAHAEACLEDCEDEKLRQKLQDFSRNPKGFIVLSGEVGCGKTHLACACLRKYLEGNSSDARYIRCTDLYFKWLEAKRSSQCEQDLTLPLAQCQLLILDDLGTRPPTEAFQDVLYALLDTRWGGQGGTIVTTNLSALEMVEKLGDQITSRIASGFCFRMRGQDRRLVDAF